MECKPLPETEVRALCERVMIVSLLLTIHYFELIIDEIL